MTYQSTTPAMPIMQKLNNFKTNHLLALADELAHFYPQIVTGGGTMHDADFFMAQMDGMSDTVIRSRIVARWNAEQIEHVHNVVVGRYRQGQRYYKKGRSFGAKNKRLSDDSQAIDALEELRLASEESEEETIKPMSYTTTPAAREPEKKETLPQIDMQKIREMIAENMKDFISAYGRDKEQMVTSINEKFAETQVKLFDSVLTYMNNLKPNLIEIARPELPALSLGVQHKQFETLLRICQARLRSGAHNNVWIYGPAGTGKSTAAENVAKALGLDYYTDGKMADETKVLGYQDANGTYRTTNFRKAFEFGGVYLADEIDGSMPDALLALNGALANSHCSFPDKTVSRHADFIFLAAANTTGQGGTIEYVGRFKQDAAFNDRFVFLDWPLDDALEESLVANKSWLATVRRVRANILKSTIKGHLITPRASIYGESLLAAGVDLDIVINSVLKKGLTEAQWNMVR